MKIEKSNKMGVYIHVPFCQAKCNYCDFNSCSNKGHLIREYFNALNEEIFIISNNSSKLDVETIFIGGGTPSFVDGKYIEEIMLSLHNNFRIQSDAEITIEANPGTLTMEKLCMYRKNGINRISIGLQAIQQNLLNTLGRIHNLERFEDSFYNSQKAGFDNINIDLIFGIPGQSFADWKQTLEKVVEYQPQHISCYSLKIEDGTLFGDMYERKEIDYIDENLEREMYYYANEFLDTNGFGHYEISNYSQENKKCKHNIIYWKGNEYFGFGAGSHSYINGTRYCNCSDINKYIEAILSNSDLRGYSGLISESDVIDSDEKKKEFMFLGLRLLEGVSAKEFFARYGKNMFELYDNKIKMLLKKGLVDINGDNLKLTKKGLDFANQVFVEFV